MQPLLRMLCASTPADDVEGFTAALQVRPLASAWFAAPVFGSRLTAGDRVLLLGRLQAAGFSLYGRPHRLLFLTNPTCAFCLTTGPGGGSAARAWRGAASA